jgi:hypothetical protein
MHSWQTRRDALRTPEFGYVPRVHHLGALLGLERCDYVMAIRLAGANSLDEIPDAL